MLRATTLLTLLGVAAAAHADGLEPEVGSYGGASGPEPYDLALRAALLGEERYRLCQLVTVPSRGLERAVYLVRANEHSEATVVSRTMKQHVWSRMMKQLQQPQKGGSYSFRMDTVSQRAALEKVPMDVTVHQAPLDAATAQALTDVCRDVLMQVRYPQRPGIGLDGVRYHAATWIRGAFLAGQTWSPKAGTIAGDFVSVLESLHDYAEASEGARAKLKADLAARAGKLAERLHAPR